MNRTMTILAAAALLTACNKAAPPEGASAPPTAVVTPVQSPAAEVAPTSQPKLPIRLMQEDNVGKHRVAKTWVDVETDGKWTVKYRYSNGQSANGEDFYTVVTFLGDKDAEIYSVKETTGVNAALGGKAQTADKSKSGQLTPVQLQQLRTVMISQGTQDNPDLAKRNYKVLQCVVEAVMAGTSEKSEDGTTDAQTPQSCKELSDTN